MVKMVTVLWFSQVVFVFILGWEGMQIRVIHRRPARLHLHGVRVGNLWESRTSDYCLF